MKNILLYIGLFLIVFSSFNLVKAEEEFLVNGKSGLLMEVSSGKILFEKNKDDRVSVASMTKMVGLIIIMEKLNNGDITLDEVVTVSKNASGMGGSQIYLETGEKMSIRDLIKGITMASANDATVAMAERIAGSESKFVEMMNAKVKDLGLKNTHFVNSTGLDDNEHFSSAYDMAIIAKELLKYEQILDFTSVYEDYLREDTDNKFWLVNTNKLVRLYEGADGLKTGFTDNAGYCMAVTAKRKDMRLLAIVLGEKKGSVRNDEIASLLDYGFNTYKVSKFLAKDTIIDSINFSKSTKDKVNVYLKEDASVLMKNSDSNSGYDTSYELDKVTLPINRNDVVGTYYIKKDNVVIDSIDLIIKEDVFRKSYFQIFIDVLKDTFLI